MGTKSSIVVMARKILNAISGDKKFSHSTPLLKAAHLSQKFVTVNKMKYPNIVTKTVNHVVILKRGIGGTVIIALSLPA
jgi:hypothetical protein